MDRLPGFMDKREAVAIERRLGPERFDQARPDRVIESGRLQHDLISSRKTAQQGDRTPHALIRLQKEQAAFAMGTKARADGGGAGDEGSIATFAASPIADCAALA